MGLGPQPGCLRPSPWGPLPGLRCRGRLERLGGQSSSSQSEVSSSSALGVSAGDRSPVVSWLLLLPVNGSRSGASGRFQGSEGLIPAQIEGHLHACLTGAQETGLAWGVLHTSVAFAGTWAWGSPCAGTAAYRGRTRQLEPRPARGAWVQGLPLAHRMRPFLPAPAVASSGQRGRLWSPEGALSLGSGGTVSFPLSGPWCSWRCALPTRVESGRLLSELGRVAGLAWRGHGSRTVPPSICTRVPRPRLWVTPSWPLHGLESHPLTCPPVASMGVLCLGPPSPPGDPANSLPYSPRTPSQVLPRL